MMGADGPRTYFMGFQTNAEARGTGGLLGGFGILRFDDGAASVDDAGRQHRTRQGLRPPSTSVRSSHTQYGFTNPPPTSATAT